MGWPPPIVCNMMGPATDAPSELTFCLGTTTATAICGWFAGAKPIIQSSVTCSVGLDWAVPVFTAAHSHEGNPTPLAVPVATTPCMRDVSCWAVCADDTVDITLGL